MELDVLREVEVPAFLDGKLTVSLRRAKMKNLKLTKKFIVAFGIILMLFLITVVATCSGIVISKSGYAKFYQEDFQVASSVDRIQLAQQQALKEMMFMVVTTNEKDFTARKQKVDEYMNKIQEELDYVYANYEGDLSRLKEFDALRTTGKVIRERVIASAALCTPEGNEEALQIIYAEYEPLVNQYVEKLEAAFADIQAYCQKSYDNQMLKMNVLLGVGIAITVLAFILTVIIGLNLTKNIATPIRLIEDTVEEVIKGNLGVQLEYDARDELGIMVGNIRKMTSEVSAMVSDIEYCLGAMASGDFTISSKASEKYVGDYQKIFHSMKQIKDNFNDTLSTLNHSANQVASSSDQVSSGAQALSQGATEQASSVEELAASISDVSARITDNAANAQDASTKSMQVGEKAGESNQRMQDMLKAMEDINSSSGEIGKIIKTIEDIAFQTNILALNAAVEAARAGVAGKGFAVVADEVRNLASKSAEASKNTAALIETSLQAVENGTKIADETAKSLEVVINDIQEASSMMDAIARASKGQAEAISQITLGIDQISSVVQTNSATAQQSAAASEELFSQAQILKDLVKNFRLAEDSLGVPATSSRYDEPDISYYEQEQAPAISYGRSDKY